MKITRLNKSPPVAQRPRCPMCNRPLAPHWKTVKEENLPAPDFRHYTLEWQGEYRGYGAFDTMRCAVDYANAVVARARKNPGR